MLSAQAMNWYTVLGEALEELLHPFELNHWEVIPLDMMKDGFEMLTSGAEETLMHCYSQGESTMKGLHSIRDQLSPENECIFIHKVNQ